MAENIPVFRQVLPEDRFIDIRWQISAAGLDPSALAKLDQTLITLFFDGDEEYFRSEHEGLADRILWLPGDTVLDELAINKIITWLSDHAELFQFISKQYGVGYQLLIDCPLKAPLSGLALPSALLEQLQKLDAKVQLQLSFY